MSSRSLDFALAFGGAAGQGIATPGDILARIFVRRGLHMCSYNAYQSIIRGGHIFLTVRGSDQKIHNHGDKLDLLVCLNQDTMDRHLRLMGPGTHVIFNSDAIQPGAAGEGVQLCPIPVKSLTENSKNKLAQNTVALGVIAHRFGLEFRVLEDALALQFQRKGPALVAENVAVARAGFDHAGANFDPYPEPLPTGSRPWAVWSGNEALAMGGAAAGVKFYCAYPMSPATGVLHWMAINARELGIMVRQIEDEIGVANMAIGAAHAGCRAMCATSGGGFAMMTEAIGSAGMMEIPVVFISVQRAGPSTGVPTKTEQSDQAEAIACQQEMKAKVTQSRAMLVLAEAEIPAAIAVAFRAGQLHARRPTARQESGRRDTRLVADTPDQNANPRQPRVDRVQPVHPIPKAKREHE